MSKIRVAVLAGARSTEHEVSLASSYNIVNAIDRDKYEVFVVGIDKQGIWKRYSPESFVENPGSVTTLKLAQPISGRLSVTQCSNAFYDLENEGRVSFECDVIFPAVLGNYAEDGTMQGMLRMMDVPFTTPDVLGSAVGMDKDIAYRLLRDSGINVAPFVTIRKGRAYDDYKELTKQLEATTLFVKPANAGSSVGVSRVTCSQEFLDALDLAFRYDTKVIVQAGVVGREVEVSIMGNFGGLRTSAVGEIIEKNEGDFYSYENKYVNSSKVELVAPANLPDSVVAEIQETAKKLCEVLECEGFGRVDFFVSEDNTVYVNEINTMPGFTNISMFPRLWGVSGVSYEELIDTLLQYAIERHEYRVKPIITDASDVIKIAAEATKSD